MSKEFKFFLYWILRFLFFAALGLYSFITIIQKQDIILKNADITILLIFMFCLCYALCFQSVIPIIEYIKSKRVWGRWINHLPHR